MTVQDARPSQGREQAHVRLHPSPTTDPRWSWVSLLPDCALVVNRDGCVVAANAGASSCLGGVVLGRGITSLLPGWRPRSHDGRAEAVPYAHAAMPSDGRTRRVQVSERTLGPDHDGAVLLLLRPLPSTSGQELFRTLVEVDPDAKILVDDDGLIVLVNARTEQMFGYSRDELLGLPARLLLPSDTSLPCGGTDLVVDGALGAGVSEVTARRRDGTNFPAEVSIAQVLTEDSRAVLAAVRDVSDRWFAQHRFQQLVEHAPDAKIIVDATGAIALVNAQAENVFGYPRADLLGAPVDLVLPDSVAEHLRTLREAPDTSSGHRLVLGEDEDLVGRRADGSDFPVEVSLSVLQTEDGVLVSAAIRDLSERRMAERRFRDLLEAAPDGKVIADEDGTIVLVNQRTEELFGWAREELVGQKIEVLLPRTVRDAHRRHRAGFRHQERPLQMGVGTQLHALRRDGSEFPVEVTLAPVQTAEGVLVSAAIRDVSERLALTRESERLKSEFFATLSHELRTPLTSIIGYGEMLEDMDDQGLGPVARRFLDVIARSAARELRLVDDLLTLVAIEDSSFDVNPSRSCLLAVVRQVVAEATPGALEAGQSICLVGVEDLGQALVADVDEQRLTQALAHLTQNVVKHCPAGTTLSVTVHDAGDALVLELADDGPGILGAELPHVFERLFRGADAVREERQGAGLGLPIAKAIVESHGGVLTGESAVGCGTTFRVVLPRQRRVEETDAVPV